MANIEILSLSLKDVKAQIDALRASMVGLDQDSAEYKVTCAQVIAQQQKLDKVLSDTKSTANAAEGSYNALQRELTNLRTQWKATSDETRRAQLGQQMSEVNARLKELDASVGNFQRNVGNYEIAGKSMKAELKEMTQELASLLAQGLQPTDAKIQELVSRAGQMRDALSDANLMISQMASDTSKLDTALDVFKTGTATMGLFQGAMAALGVENEESVKVIQKLQGTMLVLQSITQIQTALTDKSSKTYQFLNAVLAKLGLTKTTVAKTTQAQTVAEGQLTVAENANATAAKGAAVANTSLAASEGAATAGAIALRAALMAIGIGVITAAIGGLITAFEKVVGLFSDTSEKAMDLGKTFEGVKNASDALNSASQNVNKFLKNAGYISETTEETLNYYAAIKQLKEDIVDIGRIFQENKEYLSQYNAEEKVAYETAASMHNELIELSKTEEGRKKAVKELGGEYKKNSKTIETLTSKLESLKDQESDEAIRLKNLIVVLKAANREYEDLGNTISAKSAEDKKAEEEQKKREEEAEKRREAARRAAEAERRRVEKAQKETAKSYEAEVSFLKSESSMRAWLAKWESDIAKARGNSTYLTELKNENAALNEQKELYRELVGMYEGFSKSASLSKGDQDKFAAEAKKTKIDLEKTLRQIELNELRQTQAERRRLLSYEAAHTEEEIKDMARNISMMFAQANGGVSPIVDYFKISPDDFKKQSELLKKSLDESFTVTQREGFWNEYISIGVNSAMENARNIATELRDDIQSTLFNVDDNGNETPLSTYSPKELAEMIAQKKQMLQYEKTYGEELKGYRVESNSELTRLELEELNKRFASEEQMQLTHIENLKRQMSSFLEAGGSTESDEYLSMQQELTNAEIAATKTYTDYYIEASQLRMEADDEERSERKANIKKQISDFGTFAKSMGNLLGAVADAKEEQLKRDVDNGKKSEEQAKEEFERIKKVRVAELWITTIAGAAGAFLNDMGTYSFPFNAIIAAIDFATAMATGIAQTKQIKAQEFGGSAGSGGGTSTPSITSVGVSPLLNETVDESLMSQINTEMAVTGDKENRVYILESDIQASNRQVEIRQSETTF